MTRPATWRTWAPALGFILVSLGLLLIGLYTHRTLTEYTRAGVEAQLRAVGELRVEQIQNWLAANRDYALFFSRGGQAAEHFSAWQASGYRDAEREARIRNRLAEYQASFGYSKVSLFDAEGNYRLSLQADPHMAEHRPAAIRAMRDGRAVLIDFHRHGAATEAMLGFMVPMTVGHAPAHSVGAMFIGIPARTGLRQLIGRWPTPSDTGETVLLRVNEQNLEVLFASRYPAPIPAMASIPQTQAAAHILRGETGILKGHVVDYLGTPILAYGSRIAGTPWMLVAKQARVETDAPVRRISLYSALGTGLLMLLSSLAFWIWWRSLQRRQQAQLHGKDVERRSLQRRYDYLSRYAGDVILLTDLSGQILEINEQVRYLHGYSPEEIKGQPVDRLLPPEAVALEQQHRAAILKTGSLTYLAEHLSKDGRRVPVEVSGHLIDIDDTVYFHLLFRDITERQQAEARLRMQAQVLDQIHDQVTITDLAGVITYVNDAECQAARLDYSDLVGQHIDVFGNDPGSDADQAEIARATLQDGGWQGQVHNVRPDGSRFTAELRTRLVRDPAGEPLCLVGIGSDISERIAAEQALQEREALYRGVIETSADGFWITDLDGHLLEVNAAYCQRSGYSREELLQLSIADLEARESAEDTARHMAELVRTGSGLFESVHRAKDGTAWQVEVNTSYSPILGGRVFVFLRDTHQRNRSEALLRTRLRLSDLALRGSLDELMKAALDAAELFTGSHIGFFHFVDPDQQTISLQAWSSNTVDQMCTLEAQKQAKGQHYAVDHAGVWADAIRQRRPLIHNDYPSLPDRKGLPDGHAELRRELVVPILRNDLVTAVLGVGNKYSDYHADDVVVVEQIAAMVMDVVARKRAEEGLSQANARLLEAQRIAQLGHWEYDVVADLVYWSEQACRIVGRSPAEMPTNYQAAGSLYLPEYRESFDTAIQQAIEHATPAQLELRLRRPDGALRSIWGTCLTVRNDAGQVVKLYGTVQDITERVDIEARLRQAATVFDNTAEGIIVTDADCSIQSVNRAFTDITGYSEADALGNTPSMLKSGRHDAAYYQAMWSALGETGAWSGEIWDKRRNGEVYPEWLAINAVHDGAGQVRNYIAVFSDLTSRKALQARLEHQSRHHPLTGLLNAQALLEHIRQACESSAETDRFALLVLNIDRFAQLNESLGRERGDAVLIALARRWEGLLEDNELLCHMNADQFALLQRDNDLPDASLETAARLLDSMRQPIQLDGVERSIALTLSIGVAMYPDDAGEASALLHAAEDAMRLAKADKGNQVSFYDRAQAQRVRDWFETESALRGVLDRDELFLDYQPQVDTASGRIVAAEALIRWRQGGDVIPPGRFIHVVEGTDLAEPVSRWVLQTACRQARQWLDRQHPLRVAVNIFSEHVTSGHLVEDVAAVLAQTGLPAQLLELEVVESSLLNNPEAAARTLRELKRMGVGLALDDFGTGYSSLGYLKHYPFDVLKIDQMFSRSVTRDPEDAAIVRSTIALAHNLGMRVLAEGVETAPQLRFLARYGCDQLQGYLLCRPTDPAAVEMRVMERRDLRPAELAGVAMAPNLLVLEDEPVQAAVLAEVLEQAGYRVFIGTDRESAMRQVDSQSIDLIVADHYLEGITGVDLVVEIHRLYPEIPAIMVSGAQEQAVVVDAVNRASIRGFLAKPVDMDRLLASVHGLLTNQDKD